MMMSCVSSRRLATFDPTVLLIENAGLEPLDALALVRNLHF